MSKLDEMISGTKPTLVELYAPWCPHCQRMMPVMEELKTAVAGKANIVQIDGDANPAEMDKFGAKSYPTFVLFKDGQEVWRDAGEKPLSELKDMIDRFI